MDPIVPSTADLCDDRGDDLQVASPLLVHYGGRGAFAGVIETVQVQHDNTMVREILGEPGEDRVLVVDGDAELNALVGDNLAGIAIENEWAGIVVNGYVRDTVAMADMPIGVLAIGEHPRRSSHEHDAQRSVEVTFAGVTFRPGEWLCTDADGLVVAKSAAFL